MTSAEHNADPAELNRFNAHAQNWWDQNGEFKALHAINPLRVAFMQNHVSLTSQRILDIGCGGGILSEAMAKAGADVTGIDLADDVLTVARLHAMEANLSIDYQTVSAESKAENEPEHYDCVTCMEMLEHVPDPASVIQAASHALKPGGWLFVSTINRHPKAYALAIVAAERLLNLVPAGTHQYDKLLKPSELERMGRQSGLNLQASAGIDYNPLLKRCRLTHDLRVNYLLAFRKPF
ncbi:bifunctional 2-polyprenyl-6-hydroxyphenol methylase/3-demethylubiquinol 3-O-methyltransferase UbiG [Thiomicrospira sp. WB1]|uniref:bifunctional 2-polyprenyl-6-hydroxyphenol methylase/3-demethylubiquinol 3-O-methyltransferase UbiG n=1 Tax=Thiomicrospira sp. WB1 TaxID=1685380 RepID=UPI0007498AA0|nr:bifunctional 2-polyprenyl-6-hydroxyphenol methylase/3-demethylubiquinol 3-O-methyltransferase UbiG [Thiomicrospira sp. WB1]KUJ72048.1 bifunctional 3-demethylubiquinone 3-O-methyltransferase/2-octaprenyl-6-hydroxy phenol methylase [Thiomicrospira sp. WB1]